MRNVLVVCYDFPPGGGAGVKRTMKFVKYLPALGFRPTVLAVRDGNYELRDEKLLEEVSPEVVVHRAWTFETLYARRRKEKLLGSSGKGQAAQPPHRALFSECAEMPRRLARYLKVPDSRILWLPAAFALGRNIIQREAIDVIYATGPSFTNHLLGAALGRWCRRPLVCDFRDAWTADPMLRPGVPARLLCIHARQEAFVIRQSQAVITTNPFVTEDFRKRYGENSGRRYETIYNGYDPDDYNLPSLKRDAADKLRVVYTGRLYGERSPKSFLEAVRLVLTRKPALRDRIEIVFVGSCEAFADGCRIEDYVSSMGLAGVVRLTGHLSRKESLARQAEADVLLCIIGAVPEAGRYTYGISGKIFDYLPWKRPILALADEGASATFLREHGIGLVFGLTDIAGVADYLTQKCQTCCEGIEPEPALDALWEKYDTRNQTRQLANCLHSVIN